MPFKVIVTKTNQLTCHSFTAETCTYIHRYIQLTLIFKLPRSTKFLGPFIIFISHGFTTRHAFVAEGLDQDDTVPNIVVNPTST